MLSAAPLARAQSCQLFPDGGGESISANVILESTGQTVASGAVVPVGSSLRFDTIATASGNCVSACATYERSVNHIKVWSEISTATNLNGNYLEGNVFGWDEQHVTHDYQVLDSTQSNSTGSVHAYTPYPGTYRYHIQAFINGTPCSMEPYETEEIIVTVYVVESGDENLGTQPCNSEVGQPVNVTNGNMYIRQTDYRLPGPGGGLELTRTYNSRSGRTGVFGLGWSSTFDESVEAHGGSLLRLNLPEGQAVYFAKPDGASAFAAKDPPDFRGQAVRNADGSYTLTFKDGAVHQFDAAGRLLSRTDRNGNQTTLTYNAGGRAATITDAAGRSLTLTYNDWDVVSSVSDAAGVVATYEYWRGRMDTITYPDGSKLYFEHNWWFDKVAAVRDALGNVLESHTYDGQGRALTSERHGGVERFTLNYVSGTETDVTDALGRVTKYFFDKSRGRNVVTRVEGGCDCGGSSRVDVWTYDARLNITGKTNALGQTTTYTYDADGNRLTETNALGTTTYTYNAFGQTLTAVDPMNGETLNAYDAHGNLASTTDELGGVTSYTYDAHGQLLTVTDPRLNVVAQLDRDAYGNVTRAADALNHASTMTYDARGRLLSATDAANNTTSYTYDAVGRLKTVTRPDNSTVTLTYDLAGRRTRETDGRGGNTNYTYDNAYRLTRVTDAANGETNYGYDLMSNRTGVTDALGRTTNYTYDDSDRLLKTTYPEASAGAGRLEERLVYDAAGNVTQKIDRAGRATSFAYDAANRLTKVTDAALKDTLYEYDARSKATAVVDASGQRYEFTYNSARRLTQVKRAGLTMTFAYDAAGNRTRRTDYNGAITNYAYDAANRLTTISYPNSTSATYGYDAASRLTSATNENGAVTVGYDNRGRVSSTTDVWGQAVTYQYDANGNRTAMSLGAASNVGYQYDALDRPTQLTDSAGGVFTYGYDAVDRLTSRVAPNGVTAAYSYDGLDRLTRLKHTKGATTVADFQYQQNAAGNITQMTDAAGARNFVYDAVDRLTSATHPGQTAESYTYDAVGNRASSHLASTYVYQPFNRAVTIGATTYGYDANGNLTSKLDAAGDTEYFWDYENRLAGVWTPDGTVVTYKYDALGRRVETRKGASEWTRYSYDGVDVVVEHKSDATTTEYANELGVDEKLWQRESGASPLYFVRDHLGSTRALTDASGTVVETQGYDSFGGGAGSALTRYGFTGRERDADTGLYYYRARWYDPAQGRFLSEDPIGFEGGINWYAYAGNGPLNLRDPLGLIPDNPYDIIPDRGWDVIEQIGNFSAGFGDTITGIPFTNWSVTGQIRKWMGTDGVVDRCGTAYSLGGWTGVAWEVTLGIKVGARSLTKPGPGYEWSHWIPKRYRGVPDWIRSSRFNGNYRTSIEHALNDPFRYRFMRRTWKEANPMNPAWRQQLNRLPDWIKGGVAGAVWGSLTNPSKKCGCE